MCMKRVRERKKNRGKREMGRKQAAVMTYVAPAPVFIHLITFRVKEGYETPSYRGTSSSL